MKRKQSTQSQFSFFSLLGLWLTLGLFSAQVFAFTAPPQAEIDKGVLPVEQAYKLNIQKTSSKISAFFKIAPYYYLYQDKIKLKNSRDNKKAIKILPTFTGNPITGTDEFYGGITIYKNQLIATFDLAQFRSTLVGPVYLTYQGCWSGGICYPPQTVKIDLALNSNFSGQTHGQFSGISWDKININTNQSYFTQILQNYSLWLVVPIFFFLGFLLAFSPCVLPAFPLVYSAIIQKNKEIKHSKLQNFYLALIFVLSSSIAYALAGMMAGLFGENIQFLLQQKWITLLSISIMLFLAGSMFGLYHIKIPSFFQNKADQVIEKSGINPFLRAALMGIFSTLIVIPCIAAPLAGVLIFLTNLGSAKVGAIALFMLGLGMGLPLILFSTSLGHLFSKRGEYMLYIERIFGFLILLTAVYLLDRLIDDTLALLFYGIVLILFANYLRIMAGKIKSKSITLFLKITFFLLLVIGLLEITGFFAGARNVLNPLNPIINKANYKTIKALNQKKLIVTNLTDLKTALAKASQQKKIAIVIFSAEWCISCKIIERQVFENSEVIRALAQSQIIEVDVTEVNNDSSALLDFFKLFGPPAVYFYNRDGELQPKLTMIGSVKKDNFLNNFNIIN